MKQAGDPLTNVTNGSWRVPGVYTLKDTFAAENKLEPAGYTPSPGDVVLYGGSGHTNIVVGVDGDTITTIGGNESNRVSQRTISRFSGDIMGFGRIADEAPLPPAPEFVAVNNEVPPPPPPVEFVPPAPEAIPAVFDAPPPPPVGEVVPLTAPVEGVPHLSGALPGPAM